MDIHTELVDYLQIVILICIYTFFAKHKRKDSSVHTMNVSWVQNNIHHFSYAQFIIVFIIVNAV